MLRDRLMRPDEIERALTDRNLEPLTVLPLSQIVKELRKRVEDEGGIRPFCRHMGVNPSVICGALSGRRGGIGKKLAERLGLRPVILRVMAYEITNPRKFYRTPPKLL